MVIRQFVGEFVQGIIQLPTAPVCNMFYALWCCAHPHVLRDPLPREQVTLSNRPYIRTVLSICSGGQLHRIFKKNRAPARRSWRFKHPHFEEQQCTFKNGGGIPNVTQPAVERRPAHSPATLQLPPLQLRQEIRRPQVPQLLPQDPKLLPRKPL